MRRSGSSSAVVTSRFEPLNHDVPHIRWRTGLIALAVIAWAMLKASRKLPITEFFRYSAILIAVLAVVLAGKGVGALQEAGLIGVTPVAGAPRITMLGLFPTVEALGAQALTLAAVLIGFRRAGRSGRPALAAAG